jgi:hypothetical protein
VQLFVKAQSDHTWGGAPQSAKPNSACTVHPCAPSDTHISTRYAVCREANPCSLWSFARWCVRFSASTASRHRPRRQSALRHELSNFHAHLLVYLSCAIMGYIASIVPRRNANASSPACSEITTRAPKQGKWVGGPRSAVPRRRCWTVNGGVSAEALSKRQSRGPAAPTHR